MSAATSSSELSRRSLLRGTITIAGAAIMLPAMGGLAGCSSAPPALDTHTGLLSALADRIIPETDTPGAIAAGVPQYISDVFTDFFTEEQQQEFVDGLADLSASLAEESGGDFTTVDAERQDEALTGFLAKDGMPGQALWQQVRDITIFGYYTSEVATQELSFEEVPGRYDACLPLAEIGSAWLDRGV
ncbi:MAG: gluconate 2-dehydrogenase subunit 3 family protein [Pseudomonadota bacterium]